MGNAGLARLAVVNREPERPPSPARVAYLRRLARLPSNFIGLWDRLDEEERNIVILAMTDLYGRWFTDEFYQRAEARRLVLSFFVTSDRNTGTRGMLVPDRLLRLGYRLLRQTPDMVLVRRGAESWVHPSGDVIVIGPATAEQGDTHVRSQIADLCLDAEQLVALGMGQRARELLEEARALANDLQGGMPEEIVLQIRRVEIMLWDPLGLLD